MQAAVIPMIEVDNPYYEPAHATSVRRVKVERALRDDPLGQMHARHQLGHTDDRMQSGEGWVRYRAGRAWQFNYEVAGHGRIKGSDTTSEPVDGSRKAAIGITDRQLAANRQRASWKVKLGDKGWRLLDAVLIEKLTIAEAAQRLFYTTNRATMIFVGRFFRQCLDEIAGDVGLST